MTISEIRDLIAEEYAETDAYLDKMNDISDGDQVPVEDMVVLETLKAMLAACSLEQVEALRAAVIAVRDQGLEDERLPF